MIRCGECDGLCCRQIKSKTFYHCEARPDRLWDKIPKTHPRWCPKWKGVKKNDEIILHYLRNLGHVDPCHLQMVRSGCR